MTIRDLIHRENKTSLGLSLNDHLEEMAALKDYIAESNSSKEFYTMHKNMIRGMIQALLCVHTITDTEFLEIMEDIRKNY